MHGWRCDYCGAFYSTSETFLYEDREEPIIEIEVHYTGGGDNSEHTQEYTYCEDCADGPEVVNIKTLGENVES